jgi:subtilisin family serine protease
LLCAVAVTVAATVVGGLGAAAFAGPAAAAPAAPLPTSDTGLWIVQLAGPSLAAREAPAGPVDVTTASARAYLGQLADRQAEAAELLGEELGRPVRVEHSYRNVLNAVVIEAEPAEAARLAAVPGVVAVEPNIEYELTTDASHDLIGSAAFWDGQTAPELATRGEGVVVGILDTGINAFHPSFASTDGEGYTHTNPYGGFLGVCDPAHLNHDPICNDKLVGAYEFVAGTSARDTNGHGSHTASTAAGNRHEVTLTYGADEFTRTVQGVAPRANLIAYRVCITTCPTTAILAGINQAVADGVDVLNYSISGTDSPWANSISRTFLEAFGAGIFVATSAGNSGPGAGTVAHTAPWNASVAATTSDRTFANTLSVLGPEPVPPELAAVPGWPGFGPGNLSPVEAELRFSGQVGAVNGCGVLPAGAYAGAIALIPFGTCAFDVKVDRAAAAGAVAAVLFERQPGPPVFLSGVEGTTIPAVSVDQANGEALEALVTGSPEPVTIRLGAGTELVRDPAAADSVAWFSSRGPSDFNLLAPTFAAPGVNILAAYLEVGGDPRQYNIIRGTSMASPHVAGAGALLRGLHPDWSPAQIRAALAGTADPTGVRDEHGEAADPLQAGAGRIDLAAAGRVGLVLDESYANMLAANPATGGDPRTLNVPYLVDRQCNLSCQWTRDVTSVADAPASYTASVAAPAGMTATVEPATFTLAPGATQQLTITVDVSGSSGGDWVFADLQLSTGDSHAGGSAIADPHYPVAVIPVAPAITVDPTAVESAQKPDRQVNRGVTIRNQGNGPLTWELAGEPGCDLPADLPWLSADQLAGTVAPGGSTQVRLGLDSTGQPPGVLTATLCVASNDPAVPLVPVAVTLTVLDLPTLVLTPEELAVSQPAGTITGTPLAIANTGTSALDWSIGEAPVQVAAGAALAALDPGRQQLLREGVLLVPDTGPDGVAAFDPATGDLLDPAFITYPENLGTTTHIILNAAQDGFLVSSQTQDVVHAFDLEGEYQGVFAPIGGQDSSIMDNIRGMAISPWGTLLVTSAGGNKVVEFDAGGELLGDFVTSSSGGISGPWYILFREDDVLVSASSGNIYQYDHTGAPLSVWNGEINFPQQLYRQENGNVLAAAFSSPNGVWELDPDGTLLDRYTAVGLNRGVHPLANGNILTTNSTGVHEIDRGTTLIETKLAGSGTRMVSEIRRDQPCEEPADVPWLSVSDESGTTAAGQSSEVTVLVDSTGLPAGVHEAHLCVSTNDPDSPLVGVPVTVTVTEQTCDRTITGSHDQPVRVSGGLTCFAFGSVVTGPVTVAAGGSLHATGATVVGPVFATGAARVSLSTSVLEGAVFLRGGTVEVTVTGNQITGPVSLVDNHTGLMPIVVAGNTIDGPLGCTGNQPPPVNDGAPNTVLGPATGQCADL